jgi:hypothetical protein
LLNNLNHICCFAADCWETSLVCAKWWHGEDLNSFELWDWFIKDYLVLYSKIASNGYKKLKCSKMKKFFVALSCLSSFKLLLFPWLLILLLFFGRISWEHTTILMIHEPNNPVSLLVYGNFYDYTIYLFGCKFLEKLDNYNCRVILTIFCLDFFKNFYLQCLSN